jgi:hypothetical protein
MNEKDIRLTMRLKESIGDPDLTGPILIDVKSTQFVRVNMLLLKALSNEDGRSGLFISVDRPHQYMVHLLTMHQINVQGLIFIDAISQFSADRKATQANVSFVDGPFHIDDLPAAIKEWTLRTSGNSIDLKGCAFAMIDNLAALLTYNSFSAVESFLHDFVNVLSMNGRMAIPLVVDKERNQALYEMARVLCKKEVNINEVPGSGPDSDMERRSKRISETKLDGMCQNG